MDADPVAAQSAWVGWNYASPYICAALCVWYVNHSRKKTDGKVDTTSALTQVKIGNESGDIQTRIVGLQAQFHSMQDKLPEMIRKEIAPPIVALHTRLDKFESSVRSSLTQAGLKWDQEYTVVPGNKPKDIK